MNVLALCAGAGGLEIGVRIARPDARCVAMVEREAYAAAILAARMEDKALDPAPIWSDLGTFDGRPWRGVVDCVDSGDPCQDASVAGRQAGSSGDRWLAEQVLRIVDEVRPARFFRENVPGLADKQLEAFVPALGRMGYRVACGLFSAAECGGAHRRQRLFIMADRGRGTSGRLQHQPGPGRRSPDFDAGSHAMAHSPRLQRKAVQRGKPDGTDGGVGNASNQRHERSGTSRGRRPGSEDDGLPLFAPGPTDPGWPDIIRQAPNLEPAVRRMADGMANRMDRLRACGNGVFPMAAALAWVSLDALLAQADTTQPVLTAAE